MELADQVVAITGCFAEGQAYFKKDKRSEVRDVSLLEKKVGGEACEDDGGERVCLSFA